LKWRLIETAPKDGTAILVYPPTWNGRTAAIACWDDEHNAKKPHPYWKRDDAIGKVMNRNNQPTHWMPMPESPLGDR
jgi:hypothetical protein